MEGLKNKDVDYAPLRTVTPGMVFDYFANEVLKKTDKETQAFLLKTSVLPGMTARMTEALTGMDASGHILSRMNQNNYFTTARHQPERVYQYHPLFREFLFIQGKGHLHPRRVFGDTKKCRRNPGRSRADRGHRNHFP